MLSLFKLLVLPPGAMLAMIVAGLVLLRWHPRSGKALAALGVATLYFFSTGVGSWLICHPLEQLEPALKTVPPQAQAIVVLSAGRIRNSPEYGVPVPDFTALERVQYAAHLYRRAPLPILLSGGRLTARASEEPLAVGMARVLVGDYRIPVRWLETTSRNTDENARNSARMLAAAGVTRIILVTDAVHMRRARHAFEHYGLGVTPGPTFYAEPGQFGALRLLPAMENLRRSHAAMYEWFGLAWYASSGR